MNDGLENQFLCDIHSSQSGQRLIAKPSDKLFGKSRGARPIENEVQDTRLMLYRLLHSRPHHTRAENAWRMAPVSSPRSQAKRWNRDRNRGIKSFSRIAGSQSSRDDDQPVNSADGIAQRNPSSWLDVTRWRRAGLQPQAARRAAPRPRRPGGHRGGRSGNDPRIGGQRDDRPASVRTESLYGRRERYLRNEDVVAVCRSDISLHRLSACGSATPRAGSPASIHRRIRPGALVRRRSRRVRVHSARLVSRNKELLECRC
jgi:hypothetical protein